MVYGRFPSPEGLWHQRGLTCCHNPEVLKWLHYDSWESGVWV